MTTSSGPSGFSTISDRLGELAIEVPSWAYGNSGTRFKVFGTPGTPRTAASADATAPASGVSNWTVTVIPAPVAVDPSPGSERTTESSDGVGVAVGAGVGGGSNVGSARSTPPRSAP